MTTDNPSPESPPTPGLSGSVPVDVPAPEVNDVPVEPAEEAVAPETEEQTDAQPAAKRTAAKPRRSRKSAAAAEAASEPTVPAGPPNENMRWYVVKVQSGREETIKDAIERRVKIEGLQESFGQVLIPTEKVTEVRNNKRVVKERKKFPGYVMVNLEFNDRMLYLFRETSGVGDFVGGGLNKPPQPMAPHEVERMLGQQGQLPDTKEIVKSKFDKGDRVAVKDGTFAGMEGEVKEVLEGKGALRVELTIFGRPVPVELEYWQVDYA